ncbi:MAG: hypothetical protein N3B01_11785, partial [Verrucomicrobiae bacterium]|nr:hypothetical protein [Verrucomicrobiae bacterium]
ATTPNDTRPPPPMNPSKNAAPTTTPQTPVQTTFSSIRQQFLSHPLLYVAMGASVLLLDLLTSDYLLFPILFVIPVSLSAWFCKPRCAYVLAVLLPIGRFFIAAYLEQTTPPTFALANAAIRIAVLVFLAHFVARTARLTKELQGKYNDLVTVCAWSNTVQYDGEWLSFEQYLKKRFGIQVTHGISPSEAQKLIAQQQDRTPETRTD